jgi:hypothetical protein
MNERIKELAEQALEETYRVMVDSCLKEAFDDFYTEKFAELIVRECADIATIHQQNHAHDSIGLYVLDHFGIAEREDPVQDPNFHTCPYAEEIHGDYETLCDCDEESTRQCDRTNETTLLPY